MSIKKISKVLYEWYLTEATDTSGSSGSYRVPLAPGVRLWDKDTLAPFDEKVSKWDDAELAHDSYDGKLDVPLSKAKKMEKNALKIAKYLKSHPVQNDSEGDVLTGTVGKIGDSSPYSEKLNEDLAVWFGTKKKPKGSKQPKGPWVNICRKKEGGGHPPCGRPEATSKGYPKCRAAGVASKMTDSQKKAACAQKRRAEKSNPKAGKGNKPKMVSYKPKKESVRDDIKNIIKEYISRKGL